MTSKYVRRTPFDIVRDCEELARREIANGCKEEDYGIVIACTINKYGMHIYHTYMCLADNAYDLEETSHEIKNLTYLPWDFIGHVLGRLNDLYDLETIGWEIPLGQGR